MIDLLNNYFVYSLEAHVFVSSTTTRQESKSFCAHYITAKHHGYADRVVSNDLSALMNRLALSDLLLKSCKKFQSKISNYLDDVLSVSWHHLSGILCRPLRKCTNPVSIQISIICIASFWTLSSFRRFVYGALIVRLSP